ncbi:hypothetical protein R5R35_007498 [Gryllus longicercus]|uniref:Uncharacterized protein n=1 Tax=Gryllus longicercus TaxID=2509291 RepID=A0AAN9Z4Q5_9ORTH
MAWSCCVNQIPIEDKSYNRNVHAVAVDGNVFFFSNCSKENGMEIHIFHPKTGTWDFLATPQEMIGDEQRPPKGKQTYFVVAYNHEVYVRVGEGLEMSGPEIYVFNTRSLRWRCVQTTGDVPTGHMGVSACAHNGHLYMCVNCFVRAYSWRLHIFALELSTMRWEIVNAGGWSTGSAYSPQSIVPYKNRIYLLFDCIRFPRNGPNVGIRYFDLATMVWGSLHPPGTKPFLKQQRIPFVYRECLYVLLNDDDTAPLVGKLKRNEVAMKFSFERNEWEQVWFKGIAPPVTFDLVCVVENTSIFISLVRKEVYILEFLPSLRTMCFQAINKYNLDSSLLPPRLKRELLMYTHP